MYREGRLSASEILLSDEPRTSRLLDASYDLAFPGWFTYSRAERRVNEFKYLRARGSVKMNETRFILHERACGGGRFSKKSLVFGVAGNGVEVVIHDASFTVELGGPGRDTKAICRSLYCRIVHTGAQLCRPG